MTEVKIQWNRNTTHSKRGKDKYDPPNPIETSSCIKALPEVET